MEEVVAVILVPPVIPPVKVRPRKVPPAQTKTTCRDAAPLTLKQQKLRGQKLRGQVFLLEFISNFLMIFETVE
jgi:hypothetical protein